MTAKSSRGWVLALTSVASLIVALDALVVTTALSTIRTDLEASIEQLEWTVNAYNLSFAVLLLTAAALGDRFGRRRLFAAGLALFTASSAACALAPDVGFLIAARAVQGAGAALVMPLSLAIVSAAFPPERRGSALGVLLRRQRGELPAHRVAVRRGVLHGPVPADRTGLRAARRGPAAAVVDGHAVGLRADRRRAGRPDRRAAVHRRRPAPAGRGHGLDRADRGAGTGLRPADRAARHRRLRRLDGAARDAERGRQRRRPAGDRQGGRRQQHDAPARRRVRDRDPRRGVRGRRRLCLGAGVQRRLRARDRRVGGAGAARFARCDGPSGPPRGDRGGADARG